MFGCISKQQQKNKHIETYNQKKRKKGLGACVGVAVIICSVKRGDWCCFVLFLMLS